MPSWSVAFPVSCDTNDVVEFARAVAWPRDSVPPTFPIFWLALPAIRDAVAAALFETMPQKDELLIQVGQSFEYERPLVFEAQYVLDVALIVAAEGTHFSTHCVIKQGAVAVGRFKSDFRLLEKLG